MLLKGVKMDINYDKLRVYKDRIRIFLIIYFFSEEYNEEAHSDCCKVLYTEVKIQKIDFLIRNPDYLCYELLDLCDIQDVNKQEIKQAIRQIFNKEEPQVRRLEMEKFFFGAYEDIDQIIAFLISVGFIKYECEKSISCKSINKCYYVTKYADLKVNNMLGSMSVLNWYADRCKLIQKYFGDYSGTELKNLQYKIEEYKNTTYKNHINSIEAIVRERYLKEFGEEL